MGFQKRRKIHFKVKAKKNRQNLYINYKAIPQI